MKLPYLAIPILFGLSYSARADMADELEDLVGYTIIDSKTISGWRDDDDDEDDEDGDNGEFEGCEHGRVIVFTDGQTLTCAEYNYQYAYNPTAIILAHEVTFEGRKLYLFKMIVGDDVYDMQR